MISKSDIAAHRDSGSWRRLEQHALDTIDDVNPRVPRAFRPLLGGGTRLMLAADKPDLDRVAAWGRETLERYGHAST